MSKLQSYAPTATTNYTIPSANYEEITKSSLIKSPIDKTVFDSFAEIYSIITVLDVIENAFIKDYITDKEKYTLTSLRLINQYQIIIKDFKQDPLKLEKCVEVLGNQFDTFLVDFAKKFNLNRPLAIKRLTLGIPATIEGDLGSELTSRISTPVPEPNQNIRLIAECTSHFITCMDALKLSYKTREQLHPLLSELVVSLNDLSELNTKFEFQGKSKLVNWLIKLNNLVVDLSKDEIEEFLNDLNSAYKSFYTALE